MIIVAGVPLAVAGWTGAQLANDALTSRADALHSRNTQLLSERVADEVRARLQAVQLATAAIDLGSLSADEQLWAQRLVFRQVSGATLVALLKKDGSQATRPVFLSKKSSDPALKDRPAVSDADVQTFASHLPVGAARQVGNAIGPPYVAGGGGTKTAGPRVAVAVRSKNGFVLAVEIALDWLVPVVAAHQVGRRGRAFVVDAKGRLILSSDARAVAAREDRSDWPGVRQALARGPVPSRWRDPVQGDVFGAAAVVPDLGWAVVVTEPATDALAESRTLRRRMFMWFLAALGGAVLLGFVISRAVVGPIKALHTGASALEQGDLEHRVSGAERSDELGDLARAFNKMAEEVERWHVELETRVDQRTHELRESHELLSRAQKLAAVGQLGAGVAHEVNNPLAAILGMTELLLDDEPRDQDRECLQTIHTQGKRIQEIISQLQRLADARQGIELVPIDVISAARRALSQVADKLAESEIEVVPVFDDTVAQVAGDADILVEALVHLFENASKAMSGGGTLTVEVTSRDGQLVSIRVSDTGEGIARSLQPRIFEPFYTTRLGEGAKGLGLARVNQIMEALQGKVTVDSAQGDGATFTLLLPAVQARSIV